MKASRHELKVDGAVELPQAIAYLEQLVQALRSGTAEVRQGDEAIVLGPRGVVGFALRVTDRGKRQRLELELEWRKFKAPAAELDLTIGAPAEPQPEPAADPSATYTAGTENPYAAKPVEPSAETEAEELGEAD